MEIKNKILNKDFLLGQFVSDKSSAPFHHHSISVTLNLVAFLKFPFDLKVVLTLNKKAIIMKMKLTLVLIIATITIISGGCKKPPIPPGNSGGTSNGGNGGSGGGGGGGNLTNNKPPVANAGPDQTITILTAYTTASLSGRNSLDSSGMSLQFSWRQISGPSNCFLQAPTQAVCTVYNLNTPGIYSFELKVWNSNGADLDTTDISVLYPTYCQADRSEVPVGLTFLSNVPGQIQNPEIIAAGNKLIIPAWFSNQSDFISNNIYMYDRVAQSWTTIQASQARIGVVTIAAGNKIFFAGGVDTYNDNYTASSLVDIYDLSTNSWSVTNLSEARGYCKTVVAGGKVFFAGGLKNNEVVSNKIDIYDLETDSWSTAQLPSGSRQVGAAVSVSNKVFFCGGYTRYENPTGFASVFTTPTSSIDIYDINSGQWATSTMLVNKGSFAAIGVNEKIYFAGGAVNYAATFHVEELNVNAMNGSSSCLHQPMICDNDKSAVVKNELVIFFTYSPISGIENNKFDIYNMQTSVWSIGVLPPDLFSPHSFTAIATVNNEIFVIIDGKLYNMNL